MDTMGSFHFGFPQKVIGGRPMGLAWLVGWICVRALPQVAKGEDTLQITTNYYHVSGGSLREIHQSLRQNRPWRGVGRNDGLTDWKINWRFQTAPSGGGCRMASFTTRTTVVITLPTLRFAPGTPSEVLEAWQTYLGALMKHELGHVQNAKSAAAEMRRRALGLGAHGDCPTVARLADQAAKEVLNRYRQEDRAYDKRTSHGATQGAVLPRGTDRERNR